MKLQIHPDVFSARFPSECRLDRCDSRCCRHGVWADERERDTILAHGELFRPYMRPAARDLDSWFGRSQPDPDVPSGTAVETREFEGSCVFFNPDCGCALQKAAAERGDHEWRFKPRFCVMFPLVVEGGVLAPDEHMPNLWCMQAENRTRRLLDAVAREVRHLFEPPVAERLLARSGD